MRFSVSHCSLELAYMLVGAGRMTETRKRLMLASSAFLQHRYPACNFNEKLKVALENFTRRICIAACDNGKNNKTIKSMERSLRLWQADKVHARSSCSGLFKK